MSDFDESKVQRDEHGRFSGGGLGGFVAKHTGKLEGYGKGESGAGRLERDPRKETSDFSKWVASKHSIDLDLMKAGKDDRNPSTGELPATNSYKNHLGIEKYPSIERANEFIDNEIHRLTMQKEALVKEARKAEVSRVGYHHKVQSAKYALENVTPAAGDEAKDRAARAEAQKVLDKGAAKKEAEATARRDEAHKKLGEVLKQYRAAHDAKTKMRDLASNITLGYRHDPDKNGEIITEEKKDYTFSVSHDRKGNWEINAVGNMRNKDYPGEKTMNYRIEAGAAPKIRSIDKKKNITFDSGNAHAKTALAGMYGKDTAPSHSMTMTFPAHAKTGSSHPLEGERRPDAKNPDKHQVMDDFFHEVDTSK